MLFLHLKNTWYPTYTLNANKKITELKIQISLRSEMKIQLLKEKYKYRVPGCFTNHIEHEDCADEHFLNSFKMRSRANFIFELLSKF